MLDIAIAYDRYKFIGNEFLTWLWYAIDNAPEALAKIDPTMQALEVGNRIVLKNQTENGDETISIKGDTAGLEEGLLALAKGAMVTEINLIYKSEEHQWQFSLKGESLSFSGLKTPETGRFETQDDVEGMVLEKAYLLEKATGLLDTLFNHFIQLRVTNTWLDEVQPTLRDWIQKAHATAPGAG
ncbi:MAG: hypothetical protein QNJ22_12465 [Desulfosarcinaceae bacterium]|nr:hypothetical protein [Desulfosarcinaceae bacterium]